MYFRLNPECYLIKGEKLGAIYDLIDEKIYALDQQETQIVTSCEKNNPVRGDEKLLFKLKQLRTGKFYKNKVYIQKLRLGSPIKEMESDPPALDRAFLEINNTCNRNCWFCGYNGIKRSFGCMGCNKWNENGKTLSVEKWKVIIDELRDLDCKDIFITGGDLTLVWNKTIEILDYATEKFRNIYITLHQQSLSPIKVTELSNRANIIVQTDDINTVQSRDLVALVVVEPEEWEKASNAKRDNMLLSFAVKGCDSLCSDLPMMSKKKILPISMYKFMDNLQYHPCLGHTLAICYNGNTIPCPMMRSHSFGNVNDVELYTLFEKEWEEINKYWELNLDKIEKCTSCEFRYTCADCRALEESLSGKLNGKILCNYNPKEGVWL